MSIRVRLLLSYIAMLIIPLLLSSIAAVVILVGTIKDTSREFSFRPDFLRDLTQKAMWVSADMERMVANDPDRLKNVEVLSDFDKELKFINTGIVAKLDNEVIYSSDFLKDTQILDRLTAYDQIGRDNIEPLMIGNRSYTIRQYRPQFTDGSRGNVFIVTDVSPIGYFARSYFASLGKAVLLIIILTNGILTYLVSRKIVKQLDYLKHAALQIKDGNLNFVVRPSSRDEIGQLCNAFEEMRYKLKESVDTQIQYEENRKELISSISHDLKTPVTAIKGYVEGIMDGVAETPEKMDKYIKTIYTKTVDLDRMIDELFLFSKLDLRKVPFNFEKVNLKKYLEDSMEELGFDLQKRGVELNFMLEQEEKTLVAADREKLKRVIINIIENAVKYKDKEKGEITVSLKDHGKYVLIMMKDNGPGIKQEELPFIFERFYRADKSRNTSKGGSGLGLAIAKRIIEEHGGRIWAESKEGEGTTIFFTLKKVEEGEKSNEENPDHRG